MRVIVKQETLPKSLKSWKLFPNGLFGNNVIYSPLQIMPTKLRQIGLLQIMIHQKTLREMEPNLTIQESPIDAPSEMYTAQHLLPMMDINQNQ